MEVSDLDKHVKTTLISDTIKLVSTAPLFASTTKPAKTKGSEGSSPATVGERPKPYKTQTPKECGTLKLIREQPGESKLYLYSEAERIFDFLTQNKGSDFISSPQFQRMYKLLTPV